MKRKLIYILNSYSKKSAQHYFHVINLLENIADRGVEIALIIEKCDEKPEMKSKNIKIFIQKEKGKIKRALELFYIISKLITEENYRKIFIRISTNTAIISILASFFRETETYYWQSGAAFEIYKSMPLKKRIKWYATSYLKLYFVKQNVTYFVTGPETMLDYYANMININRSKMRLLYNDIDTKRFAPSDIKEKMQIRQKLGLDISKTYVLLVHRFSPVRKTDFYIPYIIKKSAIFDSTDFILIGDGPDKKRIAQKISDMDYKNVHMIGEKDNASIQDYYKACDIFINPSYTEGFPRVIIEAMACGLPIVTTDAGGTKDLFGERQRRYVVPKDNRDLFSNLLSEMILDKEFQDICSLENLERSKRYSTENVVDMYINLFWQE